MTKKYSELLRWIYALGALVNLWIFYRSWIGPDQVKMLELGQKFAETGQLSPMAKTMFGGGMILGSLLQLLVGLPLMLWQDYRAPVILLAAIVLASGWLMMRVSERYLPGRLGVVFFALYWVSVWRFIYGGEFWEPSYLLPVVALHFWATVRSSQVRLANHPSLTRLEKAWVTSFVLGLTSILALQIHGSFLPLWILTLLLIVRKKIRVKFWALAGGVLAGSLTLIPLFLDPSAARATAPSSSYFGHALVMLYPLAKPFMYWARMPSLDIGGPFLEVWRALPRYSPYWMAMSVLGLLSVLTVLPVLWVYWTYWKQRKEGRTGWFESYALYAFIALLISAAVAPGPLQGWHSMVVFHAALLPVAIKVSNWLEGRALTRALIVYTALVLLSTIPIVDGMMVFDKGSKLPWYIRDFPGVHRTLPTLPLEPVPADTTASWPTSWY